MKFVNIADLKDPNDEEGRTYREVNNDAIHKFKEYDLVELANGCRLFVHKLTRDCDGTPLYTLAPSIRIDSEFGLNHGYGEEQMRLVK